VHDSAHCSCIFCLHSWQIKPLLRIVTQVVQKSSRISFFFCGSLTRKYVIFSMSICTSGTFSISSMFPLLLLMYRLTADCDKPRMSAACCSFNPCFSTIVLAMRAFTAGKTVLTPTSHGSSIFSPVLIMLAGNIYKYDVCHDYMTCVIAGFPSKTDFQTQTLTRHPPRHTPKKGSWETET
jgi:hypothetical protein